MARKPLRPLIRSGGFYPSRKWTPLVYAGGYTTANGGEEPAPPPIEKTIIGNPIHILDALAKPAQALSVKLEPVQDLHGYDSPWPAGGGKNVLNYDAWKTVTISHGDAVWENNGVTLTATDNDCYTQYNNTYYPSGARIPITQGETITVSWEDTENAAGIVYIFPNGNTSGLVSTNNNRAKQLSYTAGSGVTYVTLRFGVTTSGVTIAYKNIQVVKGTTIPTWSPYSNICPISGWTGCNVTRTGKNLFDGTFIADTMIVDSTGEYYANAYHKCSNKILAKENTVYTLSGTDLHKRSGTATNAANVTIAYYKVDGTYIRREAPDTSTNTYKTVTTPANTAFVIFQVGGQATNVMLEESATETTYEPFGTTYPISWQSEAGTVYGGTLDVTTGKLTVNWAKIVLNGTQQISRENWKPQAKSVGWIYPYDLTRNIVGTGAVLQNIKCDTLPSMPFNSLQSINGPGIALASNQTYGISVMYPNTTLTTASAINAFLAEHPIDVVYELATPIVYDLTPTEVTLLLGENNIWSDGEMTLTYLADGNASDEEALNILLGGRYVNNHSEDEPTDREALDILLGGTR